MVTHEEYMFREHKPAELVAWSRRLDYFRFVRAMGGQANDGDSLVAEFSLRPDFTIFDALTRLGWVLDSKRRDEIQARSEGTWRGIFAKEGDPILFRKSILLQSDKKGLRFTIAGESGDPYRVTEADVALAATLEALLRPLALGFVQITWRNCFNEVTFPDYFK